MGGSESRQSNVGGEDVLQSLAVLLLWGVDGFDSEGSLCLK